MSLSEAQGGDVGLSTVVQLDASHECARKEVPRQQMAAADLAPLPIAPLVLVVLADLVFSLGHLDRLGPPGRERVDRARGPAPTRGAMAVASALRIACDDNRDSTAEALPFEGLSSWLMSSPFARGLVATSPPRSISLSAAFHAKRASGVGPRDACSGRHASVSASINALLLRAIRSSGSG